MAIEGNYGKISVINGTDRLCDGDIQLVIRLLDFKWNRDVEDEIGMRFSLNEPKIVEPSRMRTIARRIIFHEMRPYPDPFARELSKEKGKLTPAMKRKSG